MTIEFRDGTTVHADFLDEVWLPYDRGILVTAYINPVFGEIGVDWFVSFTDASVWTTSSLDGESYQIPGARCKEIAVMCALNDVREPYYYDQDESGRLVFA